MGDQSTGVETWQSVRQGETLLVTRSGVNPESEPVVTTWSSVLLSPGVHSSPHQGLLQWSGHALRCGGTGRSQGTGADKHSVGQLYQELLQNVYPRPGRVGGLSYRLQVPCVQQGPTG